MDAWINKTYTVELVVDKTNVASRFHDGLPDVFSTPDMIASMESASYLCLEELLDDDQTSLGTHVNVSHDAGLFIGESVQTTATIQSIKGRRITFEVIAKSGEKVLGRGLHERAIIKKNW